MSHLIIDPRQFPTLVDPDAKVGDEVTLTVRGRIRRIEARLIDVSTLERPDQVAGDIEIEILANDITAK